MRTHVLIKFHQIMAFQAFFLDRLSAMGTKSQVTDVSLATVRAGEKLPPGSQK